MNKREYSDRCDETNQRKDGVRKMTTAILPIIGRLVALVLIVIGGIIALLLIIRNRNAAKKRDYENRTVPPVRHTQPAVAADNRLEELREKERLADEYCDVTQAIEDLKCEEVYKKVFLRYANVYQTLIGLERGLERNELSDEEFLDEIEVALNNSRIERKLAEEGFLIDASPVIIDRDQYKKRCLASNLDTLQNSLAKQKKLLIYYQSMLNFKDFISVTGVDMYSITKSVTLGNKNACKQAISNIRTNLEKYGCFSIFSDDPAVASDESMRVDFIDDSPNATELPGLFIKGKKGNYVLIGTCCGTRRVQNGQE